MVNSKRCFCCNKKVGYLGFQCRCINMDNVPNTFCTSCRFPRTNCGDKGHDCNFDYKQLGRTLLEKNNPIIQTIKVERI